MTTPQTDLNLEALFSSMTLTEKPELPNVKHNKLTLSYTDIKQFDGSIREENDTANKIRESIIGALVNKVIPDSYFADDSRWSALRDAVTAYLTHLKEANGLPSHTEFTVKHKGGRRFNYDFALVTKGEGVEKKEYKIEFKFNAKEIIDAPQFVSPMKPSQYLSASYEEHYYDKYLTPLCAKHDLKVPEKATYLEKIHSNAPKCISHIKDCYSKGNKAHKKYTGEANHIQIYEDFKKVSKESITDFVAAAQLDSDKLSQYMTQSQEGKVYMLYHGGTLRYAIHNPEQFKLTQVVSDPEGSRYVAKTAADRIISILLRWKNGNGVAYPAFQISELKTDRLKHLFA